MNSSLKSFSISFFLYFKSFFSSFLILKVQLRKTYSSIINANKANICSLNYIATQMTSIKILFNTITTFSPFNIYLK